MSESHDFIPVNPASKEVAAFDMEEPEANWERCLDFLLEHFPQVKDGKVQYIIEGGAAVALLTQTKRQTTKDLDLLLVVDELKPAFQNSKKFDTKTLVDWFEERALKISPERQNFLVKTAVETLVRGRKVIVLHPALLALSKALPFRGRPPRLTDRDDYRALNIPAEEVDKIMHFFTG